MVNSNSYMNDYMKRRYRERRKLAFDTLGWVCVNCGSSDDLQIDHTEPEKKTFNFAKYWNCALDDFMRELKKCQLLCRDCHKLKTSDDIGVPHGGGVSGKRNCKCEPCRLKYNEWHRAKYPKKKYFLKWESNARLRQLPKDG